MSPDLGYWRGRRVVVTGGTGFLGWHIVECLRAHKACVRVLALQPPPQHPILNSIDVDLVVCDIRDSHAVRAALAGASTVFHSAGDVAVWGSAQERLWRVHVGGTQNVLEAAPSNCRIIHTSSLVAIGATISGVPLTEGAPLPTVGMEIPYVMAKRAAEERALSSSRDVVVTNPAFLIGPGDYEPSVMGRFCVRYWKGQIPFAPPGGLNLVDVRDVALAHLLAAQHGKAGRRYIFGGENLAFPEILEMLARVARYRPRWAPQLSPAVLHLVAVAAETRSRWTGREPYPSMGHVQLNRLYWYCRSHRARSELGFEPRSVIASLEAAYAWHSGRVSLMLGRFARWWMRHAAAA